MLFLTADDGGTNMTSDSGIFIYSDDKYVSVYREDEEITDALTEYILSRVLDKRADSSSWDDEEKYVFRVNRDPLDEKISDIFLSLPGDPDSFAEDFFYQFDETREETSDSLVIDLLCVCASPDNNAVKLTVTVLPKEGSGIVFNDSTLYRLDCDPDKGLDSIRESLNADGILISNGQYEPRNGGITFDILFYQEEIRGELSFDYNKELGFTVGGISAADGSEVISAKTNISHRVDPEEYHHQNFKSWW